MRTGNIHEQIELPEDFKQRMSALFSVFLEKSMESAIQYVEHHPVRRHVTAQDILLGLKREVFVFSGREDVYNDIETAVQEMQEDERDASADGSSSCGAEEVTDDDAGSSEANDVEYVDFSPNSCVCEVCTEMNNVSPRYEAWVPQTPFEVTIRNAIQRSSELY